MRALIVVGLGFGDEGKGTVTDALVRRYNSKLVVRYNGGAQAAHNVVTPDGRHHTFRQLGSGTFAGAATLLSRYMLVNPIELIYESDHLRSKRVLGALGDVWVDGRALITTPYHMALNRLRELSRGADRHGSCGMGIGETMRYAYAGHALCAYDLQKGDSILLNKLNRIRMDLFAEANALPFLFPTEVIVKELQQFEPDSVQKIAGLYQTFAQCVHIITLRGVTDLIRSQETVVFEGAQGILLDEMYGFQPHTTWSTTTTLNADRILREIGLPLPELASHVIGVTRTYMTRHGAGPFPTENAMLGLTDKYNVENPWQKAMRFGFLDLPLLKYAIACNSGIDGLAVTHLDAMPGGGQWSACVEYGPHERWTVENIQNVMPIYKRVPPDDLLPLMEKELQTPVWLTSFGPSVAEKRFTKDAPLTKQPA
jgi:adenylosuccinate synthase